LTPGHYAVGKNFFALTRERKPLSHDLETRQQRAGPWGAPPKKFFRFRKIPLGGQEGFRVQFSNGRKS
jgi:hypothetical protein